MERHIKDKYLTD